MLIVRYFMKSKLAVLNTITTIYIDRGKLNGGAKYGTKEAYHDTGGQYIVTLSCNVLVVS